MKPLTLVVCITVIAALVVCVCGCTSSSNTPTATPTVSGSPNDPLLTAIAGNIVNDSSLGNAASVSWQLSTYNNSVQSGPPSVAIQETNANGQTTQVVTIYNEGSTANATADYNQHVSLYGGSNNGNETHFAENDVTQALGHTPTVVRDLSFNDSTMSNGQFEFIQYDNLFITVG